LFGSNPLTQKSPNQNNLIGAFLYKEIGGDLLSHIVAHAVPSAQKSVTAPVGDLFRVKVRGRGCDAILWYAVELITKQICPEKIPGGAV
jgi:hypothetical protein